MPSVRKLDRLKAVLRGSIPLIDLKIQLDAGNPLPIFILKNTFCVEFLNLMHIFLHFQSAKVFFIASR